MPADETRAGPRRALITRPPASPAELRRICILANLTDDQLAEILPLVSQRSVATGEVTGFEDRSEQRCFFAWTGVHRATIMSPSGLHVTVRTVGPGDHFGELAVFCGTQQSYYHVVTDEAGLLLDLTGRDLKRLVDTMPALRDNFLSAISREALVRADRIYEFAALNARVRLQAELLRLCANGVVVDGAIVIAPSPTHEAIASQVGVSREAVTRHLKSLAQQGFLRSRRGAIHVLDVDRLRAAVVREAGRLMTYERRQTHR